MVLARGQEDVVTQEPTRAAPRPPAAAPRRCKPMTNPANPLLQPWPAPFGLPPFAAVEPEHFAPALQAAMAEHLAELDAVAAQPASADFANTALALDVTGRS